MKQYKQIYLIIKAFASFFFHAQLYNMDKSKNIIMPAIKIAIEAHSTKIFLYLEYIYLNSMLYNKFINLKSRVFLE